MSENFARESPPNIHQFWWQGNDKIPKEFVEYQKGWIESHPNWYYRCWDEKLFTAWIEATYPKHFNATFNLLKDPLQRCYYAQYLIILHFGGVVVHMDVECSSGTLVDPLLLEKNGPILIKHYNAQKIYCLASSTGLQNSRHEPLSIKDKIVTTKFFASPKAHPFWIYVLQRIAKTIGTKRKNYENYELFVRCTVGDIFLSKCLSMYLKTQLASKNQLPNLISWYKIFDFPGGVYFKNWKNNLKDGVSNLVSSMTKGKHKIQHTNGNKRKDKLKLIDNRCNFKQKDDNKFMILAVVISFMTVMFVVFGIIFWLNDAEAKKKRHLLQPKHKSSKFSKYLEE